MTGAFTWAIRAYGRTMACFREDGAELGRGMAIVQPMTEADWQSAAGALGRYDTGRFLGLAEPGLPVGDIGPGGWVDWDGRGFEVMAVRPIWVGGQTTHLWLALRPARGNAP